MTQIIAHRGASRAERENTLPAFRQARLLGADAVEFDVRRTSDGFLVVHHDATIRRDAADMVGRAIVDTPLVSLPPHVPTLGAALDACTPLWVNLEIKNDPDEPGFDPTDRIADAVVEALLERAVASPWLISSFRFESIERCQLLAPTVPTAWLTVDVPEGSIERLVAAGHQALHPWYGAVDAALVDACHAHGLAVNVWTCDDPEAMRRLASWGVDGICTNVPDVAAAVLTR